MEKLSILVVEDAMDIARQLCDFLSQKGSVVDYAQTGAQALQLVAEQTFDVILLDLSMPRVDGIETLKLLKQAECSVPAIILTTFDDHQLVLEGLAAGAKGYLLKDVSLETLCESIRNVHVGKTLVQPAITERLIAGVKTSNTKFRYREANVELSTKELEILRLMASGYSNKEIAQALFKSEGTIKNHVSNILSKFGVRDRTRAVLAAIEIGLLS